jgi:hypothetical protein
MATVWIQVDFENNAETWWEQARRRVSPPSELEPLLHSSVASGVTTPAERRDEVLRWCDGIPGWADGPEYARTALILTERPL